MDYSDFLQIFGGIPGIVLEWGLGEPKEYTPNPANDDPTDVETRAKARNFLVAEALLLGSIAAAPTIYKALATKRRKASRTTKRVEEVSNSLEGSSLRATAILASLAPAIGIPIAYMTVQQLENANVITKGLGDAVQGLLTAGVVAPAIGAVVPFLGK